MKTIYITDILNSIKPYQLVRYFKYQNKTYLIFTNNNRIKENKTTYIENYVAIKNKDDMWVEPTQIEWKQFQIIIKKIAEESNLGIVNYIQDLHIEDRTSFLIISNRSFKVIPFYHHLISSNYNAQNLRINKNEISNKYMFYPNNLQYQYETSSIEEPQINYIKEYYNLKKENTLQQQKLIKIKKILEEDFNS